MPGFYFELSQLVNVPGKDQQGRVTGRTEFLIRSSIYQVTWLDAIGGTPSEMFGEEELIEAQKKKPDATATLKVEVDDGDLRKTTAAVEKLTAAARVAEATMNRLPRNVFKLQKRRTKR